MQQGKLLSESLRMPVEVPIRIRYNETDQMGVVHHSNYIRYFEIARVEQFRRCGVSYADMEKGGLLFMIVEIQCKLRAPAFFDEEILIKIWMERMTSFRIIHHYDIRRVTGEVIATGRTVLVSVDRQGLPTPLPKTLFK